jgi:hypothetical protein
LNTYGDNINKDKVKQTSFPRKPIIIRQQINNAAVPGTYVLSAPRATASVPLVATIRVNPYNDEFGLLTHYAYS